MILQKVERIHEINLSRGNDQCRALMVCRSSFAHVDFSTAILKMHLVHQHAYQEDASPMVGVNIVVVQRVRDAGWIEPFPLVLHDDQDSPDGVAGTADVNLLIRVATVPVNDGIGKGFPECCLNRELLFERAASSWMTFCNDSSPQ